MARADIRMLATFVDEIHQEAGRAISPPVRQAAAVAVIANPFAGQFGEDLSDLIEIGAELGGLLGARTVAALGISPGDAASYGKAALVGGDSASKARCAAARRG